MSLLKNTFHVSSGSRGGFDGSASDHSARPTALAATLQKKASACDARRNSKSQANAYKDWNRWIYSDSSLPADDLRLQQQPGPGSDANGEARLSSSSAEREHIGKGKQRAQD